MFTWFRRSRDNAGVLCRQTWVTSSTGIPMLPLDGDPVFHLEGLPALDTGLPVQVVECEPLVAVFEAAAEVHGDDGVAPESLGAGRVAELLTILRARTVAELSHDHLRRFGEVFERARGRAIGSLLQAKALFDAGKPTLADLGRSLGVPPTQ